jgi:hypothetical protein
MALLAMTGRLQCRMPFQANPTSRGPLPTQVINSLNPKKSPGYDLIAGKILK